MGQFREFVYQEGEIWDAVMHGVNSGFKAFQTKRNEQKGKTEQKKLTEKIIDADKKDIKALVKKIVSNGYTISNGEVKDSPKNHRMNSWLSEGNKSWHTDHKHCFSTGSGTTTPSISKTPKS